MDEKYIEEFVVAFWNAIKKIDHKILDWDRRMKAEIHKKLWTGKCNIIDRSNVYTRCGTFSFSSRLVHDTLGRQKKANRKPCDKMLVVTLNRMLHNQCIQSCWIHRTQLDLHKSSFFCAIIEWRWSRFLLMWQCFVYLSLWNSLEFNLTALFITTTCWSYQENQ